MARHAAMMTVLLSLSAAVAGAGEDPARRLADLAFARAFSARCPDPLIDDFAAGGFPALEAETLARASAGPDQVAAARALPTAALAEAQEAACGDAAAVRRVGFIATELRGRRLGEARAALQMIDRPPPHVRPPADLAAAAVGLRASLETALSAEPEPMRVHAAGRERALLAAVAAAPGQGSWLRSWMAGVDEAERLTWAAAEPAFAALRDWAEQARRIAALGIITRTGRGPDPWVGVRAARVGELTEVLIFADAFVTFGPAEGSDGHPARLALLADDGLALAVRHPGAGSGVAITGARLWLRDPDQAPAPPGPIWLDPDQLDAEAVRRHRAGPNRAGSAALTGRPVDVLPPLLLDLEALRGAPDQSALFRFPAEAGRLLRRQTATDGLLIELITSQAAEGAPTSLSTATLEAALGWSDAAR